MSSDLAPVIRMGNDIARQFAHRPPETAAEDVATHLRKFWTVLMRRELMDYIRANDARLDPVLTAAGRSLIRDAVDHQEVVKPSGG